MESTTKKKFGAAVGGVAAVGAAISLTAGTFSYFTDTDTSGAQSVKSGHISVSHQFKHSFPNVYWKPGDSHTETYTVKNTGNVSGDLSVQVEDAGGDASLKQALKISVPPYPTGSLEQAENAGPIKNLGTIAPGDTRSFTITVRLPETNQDQSALENETASIKLVATLQTS